MTPPVHRFLFVDARGDRAEGIVAEPASVFLRTHDNAYAFTLDHRAGDEDLRRFLLTLSFDWVQANALVRIRNRTRLPRYVESRLRADLASVWPAFLRAIQASLDEQ
jgi:hypothetical protein